MKRIIRPNVHKSVWRHRKKILGKGVEMLHAVCPGSEVVAGCGVFIYHRYFKKLILPFIFHIFKINEEYKAIKDVSY